MSLSCTVDKYLFGIRLIKLSDIFVDFNIFLMTKSLISRTVSDVWLLFRPLHMEKIWLINTCLQMVDCKSTVSLATSCFHILLLFVYSCLSNLKLDFMPTLFLVFHLIGFYTLYINISCSKLFYQWQRPYEKKND